MLYPVAISSPLAPTVVTITWIDEKLHHSLAVKLPTTLSRVAAHPGTVTTKCQGGASLGPRKQIFLFWASKGHKVHFWPGVDVSAKNKNFWYYPTTVVPKSFR